jgi:hypothetical protein
VIAPRGNNQLEISSEKGVGTKVTIWLKLMQKRNEKEVGEINVGIIKEEEDKVATAIINNQMDMIWKSCMYPDSATGGKGSGGNHSDPENLFEEAPEKDSLNWKGVIGKEDSCGWKLGSGIGPSTFGSGFGSMSILGSRHAMTGLRHYTEKSIYSSRFDSPDLSGNSRNKNPIGESAPEQNLRTLSENYGSEKKPQTRKFKKQTTVKSNFSIPRASIGSKESKLSTEKKWREDQEH